MEHNNNPLHGMTLEQILIELVDRYGWEKLGKQITIRCFQKDPSISSSLKFLRKTPWARARVEALFLKSEQARSKARAPKPIAKPAAKMKPRSDKKMANTPFIEREDELEDELETELDDPADESE